MGKIIVNLDVMMARRKISLSELAERVGLTQANLSILKTGMGCQPGDILEYSDKP